MMDFFVYFLVFIFLFFVCLFFCFFFFFQAEDGIRDRSPSRGLGDVYKRQAHERVEGHQGEALLRVTEHEQLVAGFDAEAEWFGAVSYTHLTLPTNREV